MSEAAWWRHLDGDPSRFLLDDLEPGVVWRALIELLGRPPDSPAVLRARMAARRTGGAAAILERQSSFGTWGSPVAYGARWSGTAWNVVALAALGADPDDPRVQLAARRLLEEIEPRAGGFSPARGKLPSTCFTAQLCAALARFGFAHQPRVREALAWLAERADVAGGWSCPELRHLHDGACPVTAVGVLRLIAEHNDEERRSLRSLERRAGDWLLARKLFLDGGEPHGWWRFGHPSLARTDLVDTLHALARLGWPVSDTIRSALGRVLALQTAGTWNAGLQVQFGEPAGQPSRWVTLKALVAVAVYGESLA